MVWAVTKITEPATMWTDVEGKWNNRVPVKKQRLLRTLIIRRQQWRQETRLSNYEKGIRIKRKFLLKQCGSVNEKKNVLTFDFIRQNTTNSGGKVGLNASSSRGCSKYTHVPVTHTCRFVLCVVRETLSWQ